MSHVYRYLKKTEEGFRPSRARVINCNMSDMGAKNLTKILLADQKTCRALPPVLIDVCMHGKSLGG